MASKRTTMRREGDVSSTVALAVKEALNDKRMEDLAKQNTEILTEMAKGFTAIHTRQDITNGKVNKHEDRFLLMDGEKKGAGAYQQFIWLAFTTVLSLAVGLGVWILTH